jgi:hypothetical protein
MAPQTAQCNTHSPTLQTLAEAKRFPVEFLRELGLHDLPQGGVGIPYYGADGEEIAIKRRTALTAKEGSYWRKGIPLAAYGQWRLDVAAKAGFLMLVEGESDCWALWHHALPALGLPGANTARTLLREHVEAVGTLYAHREPGTAGGEFVTGVARRLAELGFMGRVFELRMPEGVKDPADLHAADPDTFKAALERCIHAATPIRLDNRATGASGGWIAPIPFDAGRDLPPFPTDLLPVTLCEWVLAEAEATQTPEDLAALLSLSISGAALATKFRVKVRNGWTEPTNLFTVAALPPGDRKSAVFVDAMAPVLQFEKEEQERTAPEIAEAASDHRMLEARLRIAEQKAAKATDSAEAVALTKEAKDLARQLAGHRVPELPRMFCDDETPESLSRLIAQQGGRMLQASAEGTAFEIVKGRYSEAANFDVYLKGHAGDPLRVGRVGRAGETVDRPALSVALAVQPDVIHGLAEQASLRGRGFLARFLYGLPISRVGSRTIAPRPVPTATEAAYHKMVVELWRLPGAVDSEGRPAPNWLHFAPEADHHLQEFERWLEPQMADGEELSLLAGWAQKLAGAAARIAGVLHVIEAVAAGQSWKAPIREETVEAAVRLARDYFLPHAQAAFALMGGDARTANARHVWASIARQSESAECSENGVRVVSRRDIHQWNRRRFPNVQELDPVLAVLVDRYYLRPAEGTGQAGRGHASPRYLVNPLALAAFSEEDARTHCTQRSHSDAGPPPSEYSECSESASPCAESIPGDGCFEGDDEVNPPGKGDAWEGD